jgi:hypothetical protein
MPANSLKECLMCYCGSDVSPRAYWGAWSKSEASDAVTFCGKSKRVKQQAAQFALLADTTAMIQAAYDWVQSHTLNLTYLDLHDKKDSTKMVEPEPRNSIDDVIKQGYGSRREIDLLFWSLLRELGVEAKFACVKDRSEDLFVNNAKYWQFDRTAVAVPLGRGNFRFYAPGHVCTPAGLIPWYLEGAEALMADADDYLVTVPFSDASASIITGVTKLTFTDDLAVKGQSRIELTGQDARILRMAVFDEDSSTYFDNLKEEIDGTYPGAEFETITFANLDSVARPFILDLAAKYSPVSPLGDRILLKPGDYLSVTRNELVGAEREGPVLFRNAYTLTEQADFALPAGWKLDALPSDTAYRNKVGLCEVRFTGYGRRVRSDSRVHAHRSVLADFRLPRGAAAVPGP